MSPQHMPQTNQTPRRSPALPRGVALLPGVVRDRRIKLGKSQIELAGAAEVSVDTVGRAENGTTISLESATAIASVLGVELPALLADSKKDEGQQPERFAETNIPEGMVPRVFRGREDDLAAIEKALAGDGKAVAITALHGLRGVGKTVLAAAYAERHRARYRAAWWIRSETEAGLRADLVGLAVRLGWVAADEKEEPALAIARERLRQEGGGILLIFDNARDVEALRPFLPRGGACHVIVTSNAPNWGAVATPVAIRVWPKETGGQFLIERTARPESARATAETLSEALGGLPLAHEMAGSYCDRTGMSFADYHRRFDAAPVHLLGIGTDAPSEYHPEFYEAHRDRLTVAKTFTLAIEEATKQHAGAEPLIVHAALLAPEPIPLFLFEEGRAAFGEPLATLLADDGLDEAIAALRSFALVDRESIPDERDPAIATDTIRLHRLVREVAGARRDGAAKEVARRALIEALAAVYPDDVEQHPADWPRARRLDAPAMALAGAGLPLPPGAEIAAGALLNDLGRYRMSVLAAYAPAQKLFGEAVAIRETVLGPDHSDTARSLGNLAAVLQSQGDLAGARPLIERALAIIQKALGPTHPDTATSLNKLAGVLKAQGDLAGARQRHERALAIHEAALGPDHPHTATGLNDLAAVLQAQGDLAGARLLIERALAIYETALGPDHPSTATSLDNLGLVLRAQGDLAGARQRHERALAIREAALGPDHPDTATSLSNLAVMLRAQGDLAGARQRHERALAIREAALGPDHLATARSLNDLAMLFAQQGNRVRARALLNRALIICRRKLGPRHPDTVSTQRNLSALR